MCLPGASSIFLQSRPLPVTLATVPTMSSLPDISVVMGVYNGVDRLRETMESVLSQEGVSLEFIVMMTAQRTAVTSSSITMRVMAAASVSSIRITRVLLAP